MKITINDDDLYNRNILIPQEANIDLAPYEMFEDPKFTNVVQTNDENLLMNEYFMMIEKCGIGLFMKTSDKTFRIMLGNEANPFLYRGENNINDKFLPSFQRPMDEKERIIEWIRKEQFKKAFKKTPYFNRLSQMEVYGNKFEFDLEALAQHYEFKTNYLDVTRNREVAEFFAYTYLDEDKRYKPISDFTEYKPCLYQANIYDIMRIYPSQLKIVGFQAVRRPLEQQAMGINLKDINRDIKKDLFKPISLEPTVEKAQEIFDKFDGGKKLFPKEYISTLELTLKNSDSIISQSFVNAYAKEFKKSPPKIRCLLKNKKIRNKELYPPEKLTELMHKEISDIIIPWIANNIKWRRVSPNVEV